jgi:hypothetical protein
MTQIVASIAAPKREFSGSVVDLIVEVTNTSAAPIHVTLVEPHALPGDERPTIERVGETELDRLMVMKRSLIEEMEHQVSKAYVLLDGAKTGRLRRSMSTLGSAFIAPTVAAIRIIEGIYGVRMWDENIPIESRRALSIDDTADVDRLREEFIDRLPEASPLRRAYQIDSDKLKKVEGSLAEISRSVGQSAGHRLESGSSMSFAFRFRVERAYREREREVVFAVSYVGSSDQSGLDQKSQERTSTARTIVTVVPSKPIVALGGLFGSTIGSVGRLVLATDPWPGIASASSTIVGAAILGTLLAFWLGRSPDGHMKVSADDFSGGFLVGMIAGLFSVEVFAALQDAIPSTLAIPS